MAEQGKDLVRRWCEELFNEKNLAVSDEIAQTALRAVVAAATVVLGVGPSSARFELQW